MTELSPMARCGATRSAPANPPRNGDQVTTPMQPAHSFNRTPYCSPAGGLKSFFSPLVSSRLTTPRRSSGFPAFRWPPPRLNQVVPAPTGLLPPLYKCHTPPQVNKCRAQVQLDWIEKTLMGSEADWKGAAPKR